MYDQNVRMIDLSRLCKNREAKFLLSIDEESEKAVLALRVEQQRLLATVSFWCLYGIVVLWAIWGIGRIAYWW